jgi:hypothetical protein
MIVLLDLLSLPGPGVSSTTHARNRFWIRRGLGSFQPLCRLSAAILYGHHAGKNSIKPAHFFISQVATQ